MKFDPYEYTGVIVPGSILVVAIALQHPLILPSISSSLSLGDLGLMLILAFVAGHFVQAAGNVWEAIIWKLLGGMPTSRVFNDNQNLIASDQKTRLLDKLKQDFGDEIGKHRNDRAYMREIFIAVRKHGSIERIEKFNRTYGFMRGTSVSFLLSAVMVLASNPENWRISVVLTGICGVFTYRMIRFGNHYARELLAEYLQVN